jgi:hypothetical protein
VECCGTVLISEASRKKAVNEKWTIRVRFLRCWFFAIEGPFVRLEDAFVNMGTSEGFAPPQKKVKGTSKRPIYAYMLNLNHSMWTISGKDVERK